MSKNKLPYPKPSFDELGPLAKWKLNVAGELSPMIGIPADLLVGALEAPARSHKQGNLRLSVPRLNSFRRSCPEFKMPKGKPAAIAEQWASQVKPSQYIERAVSGPKSSIEIYFNVGSFVNDVITAALDDNYGLFTLGEQKLVYVEYSSPNIAKPFHAGHLRSTVIGNYLCNFHKACGYKVISENYLGDWGKQYGLLAIGFEKYGSEEKLISEPIKHLYEVYVKINKAANEDPSIHDAARDYFNRMEAGDAEALGVWQKMRDLSIKEYEVMYQRLNVTFDVFGGESLHNEGMVTQLAKMEELNLLISPPKALGAKLIDLEKYKLGKVLVVKKDGATLYLTRDIATATNRWEEHQFDRMLYVVGAQQDLHFRQLFQTLKLMGYEWAERCQHINFGMVKGMSTRKGTAVFLADILDEAKHVMREQMEASSRSKLDEIEDPELTADIVGLSAVTVQDCGAKRIKDYAFEWSRVTTFEGDTGPYLQYNHARLCGIERKVKAKHGWETSLDQFDSNQLTCENSRELANMISQYPYVVINCLGQQEASPMVRYLLDLCHAISAANNELNVLNAENEALGRARLTLFGTARVVLNKGLKLLGLKPLLIM